MALIRQIGASPRLAQVLATTGIGVGAFAFPLQRLTGWAGLLGAMAVLLPLMAFSFLQRRTAVEWRGILPISLLAFLGWATISLIWSQYQWATAGGLAYLFAFTLIALYIALGRDNIQIVRAFGDVLRLALALSLGLEILSGILIDAPIGALSIQAHLAQGGPISGVLATRNQLGLLAIVQLFNADGVLTYRLELWNKIFDLARLNFLQGWGWVGRWRTDLMPFQELTTSGGARTAASALNAYLDVWFQLGLIGLVVFVGMLGLAFVRSWLLAGRRRSVVYAWPAVVLAAIIVMSLAESSVLSEFGWITFAICCLKASQELSWRRVFTAPASEGLPRRG
jgi:O-antigen ligase